MHPCNIFLLPNEPSQRKNKTTIEEKIFEIPGSIFISNLDNKENSTAEKLSYR